MKGDVCGEEGHGSTVLCLEFVGSSWEHSRPLVLFCFFYWSVMKYKNTKYKIFYF